MKRAYRLRALGSLYAKVDSDDFDRREHALFQLAMLLRRSRNDAGNHVQPDFVNDNLPRDLLRLRLSSDEKIQVVEQLTQVIMERPESRATAIWTLGEVEAAFALESAVASIVEVGRQLQNEAAFQACVALAGWLSEHESALVVLDLADMRALLRSWAGTSDARLVKRSKDLLEQLPSP
ncbi:MAG: hypothetical protein OXE46_01500 [Chloroflexi bacterium]|nr:hypothetical protein [Chloroflexota bacterium]